MKEAAVLENKAGGARDIFISYSRKDKEFVQRLDEELKARGREAWVDWEGIRPTEEFMAAIFGAIESADTFVFVLTPDSIASKICALEIGHAAQHNKRIVPIVAREVDAALIPEAIAKLNWIFGRESDVFARSVDTLVAALDTDLEWVHAHTRLLTRALEWETNKKSNSFALRGEDLRAAEHWLAQAGSDKERQPTSLQTEYIIASRSAETRRQRVIRTWVSVAAAIAMVLAGVAFYQRHVAEERRRVAQARQLEAEARVALDSSGDGLQKSALLAVESLKSAWTIEGYIACARALNLLPRRPKVWPAHETAVLALAFSVDGQLLASQDAAGNVLVRDWMGKKEVTRVKPPARSLQYAGLAFSPDGKWLVSSSGGVAVVWETATWKMSRELRHGDMLWSVAFNPDGSLLATASYHSPQLKVYRVGTWEELPAWEALPSQKTAGSVRGVKFSPDGQWLATIGSSLSTWNVATLKQVSQIEKIQPWSLAFSPDSQSIAIGGETSGSLRLYELDGTQSEPFAGHSAQVRDLSFQQSGRYLASASLDGTVRIWEVKSQRELLRLPQKASTVTFAPDGNSLVTGNSDGTLGEWVLARGNAVKTWLYNSPVKAVSFSPDGAFLVIGSADGWVRIHHNEAANWNEIAAKNIGKVASTVGFSPDGRWLVVITERSAQLFAIPGWTQASSQLDLGKDSLDVISFSPDNKWIALQTRRRAPGGAHGFLLTTRVFELASRRMVGWVTHTDVLNVPASELGSGGDLKLVVEAAAWKVMRLGGQSEKSVDGRWRTAPREASVLLDALWQRPADIVQHDGEVTDAAFSANGRWLVTASDDQSVRVWPLRPEDLLPEAMLRLQRNLTYEEWQQSMGDQPYAKTCPDLPLPDAGKSEQESR